jgi:hypothetical protein
MIGGASISTPARASAARETLAPGRTAFVVLAAAALALAAGVALAPQPPLPPPPWPETSLDRHFKITN